MHSAFIPLMVGAALVGLATLFMIKPALTPETGTLSAIQPASAGFGMVEVGPTGSISPLQTGQ